VVGNSGSGKTTLARRLATLLDVPYIELDAIYHQANWTPLADDEFLHRVDQATAGSGWVTDGNYRVVQPLIWSRADLVVYFDLPRWLTTLRVTRRTLRRSATREVLWNGNREPVANFTRWDPERNVIRWSWVKHHENSTRYRAAAARRDPGDPAFFRIGNRKDVEVLLTSADPANREHPGFD
jgi:adenylate kinase family enzyme